MKKENVKGAEEFPNFYAAKQGRIQNRIIKEKSRESVSKALDSALDITGRILDVVKESTLRDLETVSTQIDTNEFIGVCVSDFCGFCSHFNCHIISSKSRAIYNL
ncbi:hypothetical protein K501DRAFT_275432 [Backusella circina FSU 941]|nr:hypothetical protein K501DRAFT_275432 [Backusella circina FSU 941]